MMFYSNGVSPSGTLNVKTGCSPSIARSARAFRSLAGVFLFFVAFVLSVPPLLNAQVQNGTITGTVTDAKGSVIPGADVTLTQPATNLVFHGQTNNEGAYSFPQIL
ncbi:MAG: carboxypeptidase-like regulatory domain-containing protein, partial [Acidobacteriaceae bacterium]|nr:carboxypeptidase-like regulatory domain-containing protein [Acidobacteriaceae bacterium]